MLGRRGHANDAVILTSTNGAAGPWSDTTPGGSAPVNSVGSVVSGVPIEISGALVSPNTTAVTYGLGANVSQLTNLYPLNYGLWAGDCPGENFTYNVVAPSVQPGGTTGVAVPLGLVSVQVLEPPPACPTPGPP